MGCRCEPLPPLVVQNPYLRVELSTRVLPDGIEWNKTVNIVADDVPVVDYPTVSGALKALNSERNRRITAVSQSGERPATPHRRH